MAISAGQFSTPDLSDEHGDNVIALDPIFQSYGGAANFYGQIETVKCFEDNSLVKQLVAEPGLGRVMVVDGGGSLRKALLGDMLAEQAVKNGWAGFIINGCIRDAEVIAKLPLGVRALNTSPIKTEKKGVGEQGCSVRFAGVSLARGQYVYADVNGILLSDNALF
ncbi:ribonuclease E activity regulator RraA [Simiduia curdlanivorans]|uniref:4-hydroxy-4-methyl-2-oxoglutarate aldolase n=1 Tax=Simiduia curdlanivorans TaxID=1492769 RepID=A0ABV8V7H5_9GAMM|nr:ribonuclease E activity regulator RraA [Simiduia curdlanivorans]MDN3639825.1 ribonuclease E activity regulator RraA [Simiduia curdlanivorans]